MTEDDANSGWEQAAYWKAAYERMAARNIELSDVLKAVRSHRPDFADTVWDQVDEAIRKATP